MPLGLGLLTSPPAHLQADLSPSSPSGCVLCVLLSGWGQVGRLALPQGARDRGLDNPIEDGGSGVSGGVAGGRLHPLFVAKTPQIWPISDC